MCSEVLAETAHLWAALTLSAAPEFVYPIRNLRGLAVPQTLAPLEISPSISTRISLDTHPLCCVRITLRTAVGTGSEGMAGRPMKL